MLYVKLLRLTLLTAQKAFQRNTKDVLGLQDIGFIRNDWSLSHLFHLHKGIPLKRQTHKAAIVYNTIGAVNFSHWSNWSPSLVKTGRINSYWKLSITSLSATKQDLNSRRLDLQFILPTLFRHLCLSSVGLTIQYGHIHDTWNVEHSIWIELLVGVRLHNLLLVTVDMATKLIWY